MHISILKLKVYSIVFWVISELMLPVQLLDDECIQHQLKGRTRVASVSMYCGIDGVVVQNLQEVTRIQISCHQKVVVLAN
jgi:hypothetical protein